MTQRDAQDARREFLKTQLRRISAHWPLSASADALDEYARVLWGFSDAEITAGFDHVIDTYTEAAAPKPGLIRTAVGQVAKARRHIPPPEAERVAKGEPIFAPATDIAAMERWAQDPAHQAAIDAELEQLTQGWDAAALQYRDVLRPTATRHVYERMHDRPRLVS